jgi:hypothetical protein
VPAVGLRLFEAGDPGALSCGFVTFPLFAPRRRGAGAAGALVVEAANERPTSSSAVAVIEEASLGPACKPVGRAAGGVSFQPAEGGWMPLDAHKPNTLSACSWVISFRSPGNCLPGEGMSCAVKVRMLLAGHPPAQRFSSRVAEDGT